MLHPGDEQPVAGAGGGYIEQWQVGIIDILKLCLIRRSVIAPVAPAYGAVAAQRQAEIINDMRRKAGSGGDDRPLDRETFAKVIAMLQSRAAG